MEFALPFWLPYQGLGSPSADVYTFRSGMEDAAVCFFPHFGIPNDPSWATDTKLVGQYKPVRDFFLEDFYPFTEYSTNSTPWLPYQFDRPDLNVGLVQAFRRDTSGVNFNSLPLFGLDPLGLYAITNLDVSGFTLMSCSNLMSKSLPVNITSEPGAVVFSYTKMQ